MSEQHIPQGAPDPAFQLKHVMSRPRPANPAGKTGLGLPNVGAGADVAAFHAVGVPRTTRTRRLKSEQENHTELYGTAPYLGQGDGVMLYPELSTQLRNSCHILRGSKDRYHLTERVIDRWDFVREKNVAQPVLDQVGVSSRMDPVHT